MAAYFRGLSFHGVRYVLELPRVMELAFVASFAIAMQYTQYLEPRKEADQKF